MTLSSSLTTTTPTFDSSECLHQVDTIVANIVQYNLNLERNNNYNYSYNQNHDYDDNDDLKRNLIDRIYQYYSPNNLRFTSHEDAMDWLFNDIVLYVCFYHSSLLSLEERGDDDGVRIWHQIDRFISRPVYNNPYRQSYTDENNLQRLIQGLPLHLLQRLPI
jgi:hypothetical protein